MLAHASHRHPEARLIVFTNGRYVERAFGFEATFGPGDFVVRPAWFGHDGLQFDSAGYQRIPVSRDAVCTFFASHGWRARRGRLATVDFASLGTDPAFGDAVLAQAFTTDFDVLQPRTAIETIAGRLAAGDETPLRRLCEEIHMEPWTLTRMFRRAYGMTPVRYRQEARVQRALRRFAETSDSLSTVAADAGFSDQSHLSRAVMAATGRTPATLRRTLALG